ncbi:hypothetical protein Taro_028819 [Colocasia esculenta]|uniref:Uncharacterized protein n=1 Tax=Colocasia esculenta TaxID=4460 RepID=A0A843VRH2_COLES|nr:hypothetical protein [Colocasia esculenta]
MLFLTCLFGVSRGDTWLFLPNLVEVWDVWCLCRETLVSHGGSGVPFCHGSVDTPIDGVDTGSESLMLFHENRVKCVDTVHGRVDTRPRFQEIHLSH